MLTSRRWPSEYSSGYEPCSYSVPLSTARPPSYLHPSFHTLAWNTSSTPGVFCTCQFVCLCEGTLSSRRVRRTHFLCQIASHIPHSPSIRLARPIFFANSCSFSLSSSLYGGFCQLSEAQNPDSFHELNMILKNTTHFPPHTQTHSPLHTHFSRIAGWREQVSGSGDSLFLSPHTDRWRVRALMKADGSTLTHTQTGYPWDTADVCGKIGLPCKI